MLKPKLGLVLLLIGGLLVFIPFLVPLASTSQGTITIERVAVDKYVVHLTGGQPNTQYTLQYSILATGTPSWTYAGVFVADSSGSLSTFQINLPTDQFPVTFRFTDSTTGIATYNTVTVDPNNPPPLDSPVQNQSSAYLSYVTWLGLGTIAIGAVVTAVEAKKLKLLR